MVTLDDLMSYTYYIIRVEARNRYTILENADNPTLFGAPSSFRTTEGGTNCIKVTFSVTHSIRVLDDNTVTIATTHVLGCHSDNTCYFSL